MTLRKFLVFCFVFVFKLDNDNWFEYINYCINLGENLGWNSIIMNGLIKISGLPMCKSK